MSNKSFKVMILEDEPPILEQIRNIIESETSDMEVVATSYNGSDGLVMFRKYHPDIVLCDIQMPLMDGLDFIKHSREIFADSRIIILSGHKDFDYAKAALKMNVADYLLKPVDEKILLSVLKKQTEIISSLREDLKNKYMTDCIFMKNTALDSKKPLFKYPFFWPLLIQVGSIQNRTYSDTHERLNELLEIQKRIKQSNNQDFEIWLFEENYNCIKCVINTAFNNYSWAERQVDVFLGSIQDSEIPVSAVLGNVVINLDRLSDSLTNLPTLLERHCAFGESNRIFECDVMNIEINLLPLNEMREQIRKLAEQNDYGSFEELFLLMISQLRQNKVTQQQLQTYLYAVIHQLRQKTHEENNIIDINMLFTQSHTYKQLADEFLYRVKLFYSNDVTQISGGLSAAELVDTIEQFLLENYANNITGKKIYQKFGFNEVYISGIFKKEKGITPRKFILDMRMKKAIEIINAYPDIRIKTIAKQVGYNDPFHFSRVFKEYTGMSPRDYIDFKSRQK